MIDKVKMDFAINEYVKNPYWKEIYDNAPVNVKSYLSLDFYDDEFDLEVEEYLQEIKPIELKMTKSDWQYLIDNTENQIAKSHYKKKQLLAKD